jgi:hypothetical protein
MVALASCGGGSPPPDRAAILSTVHRARDALVAGRVNDACALLTPHGRRRTLGFNVDFDHDGAIQPDSPRLPQTCERLATRMLAEDHKLTHGRDPGQGWVDALKQVRFALVSSDGSRATVTDAGGSGATLKLVETPAGWRIDDSNAIPSGH